MISIVFMFSMIYMAFGPQLTSPGLFKNFMGVLDKEQAAVYKRIIKGRVRIIL